MTDEEIARHRKTMEEMWANSQKQTDIYRSQEAWGLLHRIIVMQADLVPELLKIARNDRPVSPK